MQLQVHSSIMMILQVTSLRLGVLVTSLLSSSQILIPPLHLLRLVLILLTAVVLLKSSQIPTRTEYSRLLTRIIRYSRLYLQMAQEPQQIHTTLLDLYVTPLNRDYRLMGLQNPMGYFAIWQKTKL